MSEEQSLSEFLDGLPTIHVIGELTEEDKVNRQGKPYVKRRQSGVLMYVLNGFQMSMPCQIPLGRQQPPFELGVYKVAGSMFKVNDFGDLVADGFETRLMRVPDSITRLLEQDRARRAKAA